MLCVIDEFSRKALTIRATRKLSSMGVIDTLVDLFIALGILARIRSDQGPSPLRPDTFDQKPHRLGQHVGNGCVESFNGKLCDE
jgi:hypothetical protein